MFHHRSSSPRTYAKRTTCHQNKIPSMQNREGRLLMHSSSSAALHAKPPPKAVHHSPAANHIPRLTQKCIPESTCTAYLRLLRQSLPQSLLALCKRAKILGYCARADSLAAAVLTACAQGGMYVEMGSGEALDAGGIVVIATKRDAMQRFPSKNLCRHIYIYIYIHSFIAYDEEFVREISRLLAPGQPATIRHLRSPHPPVWLTMSDRCRGPFGAPTPASP